MNDIEWKQKVYDPYLEAWKILKLIQHGSHHGTDELWEQFNKEAIRLSHTYPQNRYIESLCQMLLEAADYIAEENSRDEMQS